MIKQQIQIYFGSPARLLTTTTLGALALASFWWLANWAVIEATWQGAASDCRANVGGACWPFLTNKISFILFGFFPQEEIGRVVAVCGIFAACILFSLFAIATGKQALLRWVPIIWVTQLVGAFLLMKGGLLGLAPVPDRLWSGLPLTLVLSVCTILLGLPLGTLIALGRTSGIRVVRMLCLGFVEVMRALPIIAVLFIATIIVPLFLPFQINISNLFRALIGLLLVAAAYFSEIVRSGLNSIPKSQYEAAHSLGLSKLQRLRLVILPQVFSLVVPPLVSQSVSLLKDTTLIVIVSQFDLVGTARLAVADPQWTGYSNEAFIFIGAIYFVMCWSVITFGELTENHVNKGKRR
ncbi:amino acid ABC transporter permease [Microvirga sp. VF16]|uniref:amino acid ABC transporter permease n=1 Tax=Microvirga sp. VF16 TaxID=2807101 RepID=UPI00193CD8AE|nr:amino acid ABC transporter permease [Microvirga sp. VF16]QRM33166.1 amino acid ABC transporter permease [Microvirga sp. VF16]